MLDMKLLHMRNYKACHNLIACASRFWNGPTAAYWSIIWNLRLTMHHDVEACRDPSLKTRMGQVTIISDFLAVHLHPDWAWALAVPRSCEWFPGDETRKQRLGVGGWGGGGGGGGGKECVKVGRDEGERLSIKLHLDVELRVNLKFFGGKISPPKPFG